MFAFSKIFVLIALVGYFIPGTIAQYSGTPGPTTPLSEKKNVCSVLNYGGKADNSTDIGLAITSAFKSCVLPTPGSTLYIPPGTYALKSTITLTGGTNWAFQLDGLIVASYAGTISGNMIVFKNAEDLEVFSSNGEGAINGQGYLWRIGVGLSASKPRIMRFTTCTDFIVRNILLVDAPQFHLIADSGNNYEIANITIRGPSVGGTDGIDVSGNNFYVHDVDVSNRDECVCIKSPASNATIARSRCNQSGGMSIGSLQAGAAVENILFDTIDVYESTQGLMIKTYPSAAGTDTGYVKNVVAKNFRLYSATYSAYITQYWQSKTTPDGAGVQLSNITFDNWSGTNVLGYTRGEYVMVGSEYAIPYDITISNFNMWTDTVHNGIGELNRCSNMYGTGGCLATGSQHTSGVSSTETLKAAPTGFIAPTKPSWGVAAYPVYAAIPVYSPVPSYPLDFGSFGDEFAELLAISVPAETTSVAPVAEATTVATASVASSAIAFTAEASAATVASSSYSSASSSTKTTAKATGVCGCAAKATASPM